MHSEPRWRPVPRPTQDSGRSWRDDADDEEEVFFDDPFCVRSFVASTSVHSATSSGSGSHQLPRSTKGTTLPRTSEAASSTGTLATSPHSGEPVSSGVPQRVVQPPTTIAVSPVAFRMPPREPHDVAGSATASGARTSAVGDASERKVRDVLKKLDSLIDAPNRPPCLPTNEPNAVMCPGFIDPEGAGVGVGVGGCAADENAVARLSALVAEIDAARRYVVDLRQRKLAAVTVAAGSGGAGAEAARPSSRVVVSPPPPTEERPQPPLNAKHSASSRADSVAGHPRGGASTVQPERLAALVAEQQLLIERQAGQIAECEGTCARLLERVAALERHSQLQKPVVGPPEVASPTGHLNWSSSISREGPVPRLVEELVASPGSSAHQEGRARLSH